MDRRQFMGLTTAFGLAVSAGPARGGGWSRALFEHARRELERLGDRIAHRDIVGVADYSRPSWEPRFHLLDMGSGKVSNLLVAHGRGSDPGHEGWVQRFSNAAGSYATSAGAYVTSDYYVGRPRPST
jgi:hypothetical protein